MDVTSLKRTLWNHNADVADQKLAMLQKETDCAQHSLVQNKCIKDFTIGNWYEPSLKL